ncbi:hypothetical protein BWI17_11360 [Betaproteobacteria bacterium GR16-43]|nr:hypothetical protein BWI17_11360 [Betaproteobacteria bacterium GR16-43]
MDSLYFGPYRLEVASRSLYRGEEFIPLTPKVAETLFLLLEEAGRVVTKEQMLERVWPGVVVEEGGIANNISTLRKILNGEFGEEGAIATIPRRGYRFTAEVTTGQPSTPASTRAHPAAGERNTILVADIENKTGDPLFDGTIRQALALHLAQSPELEIMSDRKVHSVLAMMHKPGVPVLGEVALEICQRTGTRAAVTGSIFALGDEYVIGLYAIRADTGDTLVSEQARARGKGGVLQALDQAALNLRSKLGESIASVQKYAAQFDEVATSSLEALKAYATGRDIWLSHSENAAIPHMQRAIELDEHFVSAHSALAVMLNNMGQTARGAEHIQRAFDLRNRATERERLRIEAMYYDVMTGDLHRSLDAYRSALRAYPRDANMANNTANLYIILGQYEKALRDIKTALTYEHSSVVYGNYTQACLGLGLVEEAHEMIEQAFARGYDAFYHHADAYLDAFLRNDPAEQRRHLDAVAGREGEEDYMIALEASTEGYFGRFARARELSRRAVESALRSTSLEMAAIWRAESALRDLEAGYPELARKQAEEALGISRTRNLDGLAGMVLARTGDIDRAERLGADMEKAAPQATHVQRHWLPCIRGCVAMARGDWKAAVDALEPALPIEMGIPQPFISPGLYPPYLRAKAYAMGKQWSDALREYEKITSRPHLIRNQYQLPLSWLGASTALAALGRKDEAAAARARFDTIFQGADRSPRDWT